MNYLIIFLVVWLAMMLLASLLKLLGDDTKAIFDNYPKKLILKGFLSPRFLEGKLSDDHLQVFVSFRRRNFLFWFSILAVYVAFFILSYIQIQNESDDFLMQMQEKYLSK